MPDFWMNKVLAVKRETVYGTDSAPTGAANAFLAQKVKLTPMRGKDVARELARPLMGADATLVAGLHAMIEFEVELAPSGTAGTAPAWGDALRGCAVAQTINAGVSVVYSPVSTGHDSVTIHFYVDGKRYAITGARGTAKLMLAADEIPKIAFTFTGLYLGPTTVANPVATLTGWREPQVAQTANTPTISYNAVSLITRSLEFDLGNTVVYRNLIGSTSILIPQRSEKIAMVVESVPFATLNPYALAAANTVAALSLVHGTGVGKIATLAVPNALMQRPEGLQEQDGIVEWPLAMVPLPGSAGNDQWTLTLT